MRFLIIATLIAALSVATLPGVVRAASTADEALHEATLSVTGVGRIVHAPDMATVAATIVTNDDSAARALTENNRRFNALGAKLSAAGIAPGDLISASISSYFSPRSASANAPGQLFGYIVTRNVEINVNSLDRTGAVVDASTAAGATQIDGVSYGLRDRRAAERAALSAAMNDANAQAQAIAAAAHVQIVRILRIGNDSGGPGRIQPLRSMSAARTAEAPVPTTIAPADLDVTNSLAVTYVIR